MQFVEVTGAVPEGEANPGNLPVIRRLELVPVRAGLAETGSFQLLERSLQSHPPAD